MRVAILVQAQWNLDVSEERVATIEPSRRPEASPCFGATIRLEQQGLTPRDREQPSSRFRQRDPINRFSVRTPRARFAVPAGRRKFGRRKLLMCA